MRLGLVALACVLLVLSVGGCRRRPPRAAAPVQRTLVVSGAASSLTRLTQDPADELRPRLSPDGHILMFSAQRTEDDRVTGEVLVSVDPATGARRTIYTPEQATSQQIDWMPDGSSFVYRSNRSGPWALVRSLSASPNSGVAILMDENQAPDIGWPSLSADSRRIAAHARIAGVPSIITLDMGNMQYAVLGEGQQPDFDPHSERIAFSRLVAPALQLFTFRASDGTDVIQVTSGGFNAVEPCYSPDGQWIVFASNRSSSSTVALGDGTLNLFAIHPDGSGLTQLTDGNSTNDAPFWGADGWLYFASNQAGNFDVWRLLPAGGLAQTSGAEVTATLTLDTGTPAPAPAPATTP